MGAIVAIVGRPNVGKSTFFNRLIQRREAIVDAVSGVTRDRHYGKSDWNGKEFSLIDTGGYVVGSDDVFEKEIDKQQDKRYKGIDTANKRIAKKQVKMATGVAFDKRYKGGNMTGASKAIDKIKPGLSNHPKVKDALRRANEEFKGE